MEQHIKLLPDSCSDCRFLYTKAGFLAPGQYPLAPYKLITQGAFCLIWHHEMIDPDNSLCSCGIIKRELE